MPYVLRGPDRRIVAVYDAADDIVMEQVRDDDPQLIEYLSHPERVKTLLSDLDADMVRVVEDLIEILIAKQLILPTDFPEAVQHKLLGRQQLRKQISGINPMLGERDII